MLKLLGAVCITLAGWQAGNVVSYRATLRKRALYEIVLLLRQIDEEIRYRHGNLAAFYQAQYYNQCSDTQLAFFKDGTIQALQPPRTLTAYEKQQFVTCFSRIGYTTAVQESARLQPFLQRFEQLYHDADNEERAAKQIHGKIGCAVGAMIALVCV